MLRITARPAATGSAFASMFFLGVGNAIVGATAQAVGLPPAQIGSLVAVQNLGMGIAVVAGGALADLYPKPRLLFAGTFLLAASFATLYRSDLFGVNLAVMLVMGCGLGLVEAVTDALLMAVHDRNESRYVTVNHFFVSVGSVAITLYLMFLDLDWRDSLVQVAAALILLSALCVFLRPVERARPVAGPAEIAKMLTADAGMLLLFLSGILAIGLSVGSVAILTTFLTRLRGLSAAAAQGGLATFLVGLAGGRILVAFVARRARPARVVRVSFVVAAIVFTVLYAAPLPAAALLPVVFVAGLATAPLLPLTIALAGLRFRAVAGTAMGVVKLAIPIGGFAMPALVALLSETVSFAAALYLFPAAAVAGIACTAAADRVSSAR